MIENKAFPFNRLLIFFGAALFIIGVIHLFSTQVIYLIPAMSRILFPVTTIFLMVFHILIAVFMLMKYLCDKHRLYLMAIAFAFLGSAGLMLGTLSSYTEALKCTPLAHVDYNGALIFYIVRNILMAILFIVSIYLYRCRHSDIHSLRNHAVILSAIAGFTATLLFLAWLFASEQTKYTLHFIDNPTGLFTLGWHHLLFGALCALWSLTLTFMLVVTHLRNIFWFSGCLFCAFYLFTLILLLPAISIAGYSWYQSRLFEATATLTLIIILLGDVFTLYRESNSKYQDSYQNSIRDAMTHLFNRSFFYDSLTKQVAKVSSDTPVSVIVCDLDHFKHINDRYGHLEGDKVIQFVAKILQEFLNTGSLAARIGGEEFALLLPNTDAQSARAIAEQIRGTVSESSLLHLPEQVTISMGLFTALDAQESPETYVKRADEAMYQAKEAGRNRVMAWQA
ncbi:GGDEF domain-containing protein [Scandinavium goeteborgense]|uniref:sensor domain-containing diguanylate cyclase n=1 Tax=Scandinavium goeteborgense TaxID=1851514 RepID=UPI000F667E6D|nr:GGDEF domain-containing protein [Scandinavium goeteborgense]QKN81690.1 GGDEF domain-containing protein [Scandinavium goeteborgense]